MQRPSSETPAKKLEPIVAKHASRAPLVAILGVAALAAVAILAYIVMKEKGTDAFGDPLSLDAPEGKRRVVDKPEDEPEPTVEPPPPPPPPRAPGPLPKPDEDDIYDEADPPPPPPAAGAPPSPPPPEQKFDPSGI